MCACVCVVEIRKSHLIRVICQARPGPGLDIICLLQLLFIYRIFFS